MTQFQHLYFKGTTINLKKEGYGFFLNKLSNPQFDGEQILWSSKMMTKNISKFIFPHTQ